MTILLLSSLYLFQVTGATSDWGVGLGLISSIEVRAEYMYPVNDTVSLGGTVGYSPWFNVGLHQYNHLIHLGVQLSYSKVLANRVLLRATLAAGPEADIQRGTLFNHDLYSGFLDMDLGVAINKWFEPIVGAKYSPLEQFNSDVGALPYMGLMVHL